MYAGGYTSNFIDILASSLKDSRHLTLMHAGGYTSGFNETLASMEVWDPNSQTWTNGTDMPTPQR